MNYHQHPAFAQLIARVPLPEAPTRYRIAWFDRELTRGGVIQGGFAMTLRDAEDECVTLACQFPLYHYPWPENLIEREAMGKAVRIAWIEWAKQQPEPKESWLKPWEELSEPDKEVDRRIAESIAVLALAKLNPRP